MSQVLILCRSQTARTVQQYYYVWHLPLSVCLLKHNKFNKLNYSKTTQTWPNNNVTVCVWSVTSCLFFCWGVEGVGWSGGRKSDVDYRSQWYVCVWGGGISSSVCHGWIVQSVRKQCPDCLWPFPDQCFNTHGLSGRCWPYNFSCSATKIWFQSCSATIFLWPVGDIVHCNAPFFSVFISM